MNRCFTNLLVDAPDAVARFYEALLGMTRHFDSEWFVLLTHPAIDGLEVGLLDRANPIVPDGDRAAPAGVIVTFVVDDVAAVHAAAQRIGAPIVEPPTDMPYGQRRLLLRDPAGTLVDVSAPAGPPPAG
jgi:predicted enzyme related to lactoylglutathione lyase